MILHCKKKFEKKKLMTFRNYHVHLKKKKKKIKKQTIMFFLIDKITTIMRNNIKLCHGHKFFSPLQSNVTIAKLQQ